MVWRDGDGTELDRVLDPSDWFARALDRVQTLASRECPVMLSIDPYGNTTIMPPRTDTLASELERVRNETVEPEARIHLGMMLTLARAASNKPGSFIECHGD